MMEVILQRLAELERRLSNLIMTGVIVDTDYPLGKVKVAAGLLTTGWVPWLTHRAGTDTDYWAPEVGEQVMLLSPCGEPELGVVLPALYQDAFPATDHHADVRRVLFADGADFSYDRKHHGLTVVLPGEGTTTLISKGGVNIIGDVTVTGSIKATGDITDHKRAMDADRAIFNGHNHKSPETGASTSIPDPQQ
ncbi:phage baseplate assembly protein V [Veronia pacifica]|uniref:Baseplate assembly protein n=1 Tax=Veronia pacifica TaxID=1080227 RepID=A0A1C3EL99_9GAMM|nr:phage baseplate assembly protein V [Veronia pacifica]ODA34018.1 baseplate assembly protein [Veronia pacifica]